MFYIYKYIQLYIAELVVSENYCHCFILCQGNLALDRSDHTAVTLCCCRCCCHRRAQRTRKCKHNNTGHINDKQAIAIKFIFTIISSDLADLHVFYLFASIIFHCAVFVQYDIYELSISYRTSTTEQRRAHVNTDANAWYTY